MTDRPAGPGAAAVEKARLRAEALALRQGFDAAALRDGGPRLRDVFLASVRLAAGAVVSGYWPFDDEMDPRPLMTALAARGHPVCLPAVTGRGVPLEFRPWTPDAPLVRGPFGTRMPPPEAGLAFPAVLLVPMLAFDRAGNRLGFGGGYYDRTLAALSAGTLAVGLAFAAQEAASLPVEGHDRPMDWIVTEREAIALRAR